jgi:serine/threonine protein phosphatase PrpC
MASAGNLPDCPVPFAVLTDAGTDRQDNEDACGWHAEASQLLIAVADGVSGEEGGEVASQMAIEATVRAYRESPREWAPGKRLYRAAQQANIEIHDRALVVTELRRMSTTLTAIVVDRGVLYAAHVGDSRLYSIRSGKITQMTKDHTVAGVRRRMGLLSATRAQSHPGKSTLTRSVGRELIVAVDRIEFPVSEGEIILVCTDGLYNVLGDDELREGVTGKSPADACRALVDAANKRGTPDNLTAAVVAVTAPPPDPGARSSWRVKLSRLLGS